MKTYKILNQTIINDQSVLTLNKKRDINEYGTSKITTNGKEYDYTITHNQYIICAKTVDDLVGKVISFVA